MAPGSAPDPAFEAATREVKQGFPLDPFFRGRYQEKLGEVRGAIREIEAITNPIRRALHEAESRLAVLKATEANYLEALRD